MDRVKSKALFLKVYNTKAKTSVYYQHQSHHYETCPQKPWLHNTSGYIIGAQGASWAGTREAGSWAAAAGPACHRWRILRWSGRRPYRWCCWSGPESLLVFGWRRWLCCTSSCLSDDWKDKKKNHTHTLRRKGIFIKCGFKTEIDYHPYKVLSPRFFPLPKRPMNGLSMIPWSNQASLSARALSRSPDELGLKYLNHREDTKPSDTDSLFKTSTSVRSKKQKTQLRTICKKMMHFSTHDQNWLPPPTQPLASI